MKILLVYPGYRFESVVTFEEPLGILYLASTLQKAGHDVEVADLTFKRAFDGLDEMAQRADVVGISSPTPLFGTAVDLLNYIKEANPRVPTVLGGSHVTADPEGALLEAFDCAVLGEGEATFLELVETMGRGDPIDKVAGIVYREEDEFSRTIGQSAIRKTEPRPYIQDIDNIPLPAREFIDYRRYRRLGVIATRGCPWRCNYCKPIQDNLFGNKLRRRTVESVGYEIEEFFGRYGIRNVSFKDDTLTVYRTKWFNQFGEYFKKRDIEVCWQCQSRVDAVTRGKLQAMKDAGCTQIFFGVESGSQKILDYYNKEVKRDQIEAAFGWCHEVGIRPCASLMLGAPPETRDDMEETYQLVKRIKPFNWQVHVTTPIKGAHLYETVLEEGRFTPTQDYTKYEPTGNIYKKYLPMQLDHVDMDDITEYRTKINRYMKFRVLRQSMTDLRMWRELLTSSAFRNIAFSWIGRHFKTKRQENSC